MDRASMFRDRNRQLPIRWFTNVSYDYTRYEWDLYYRAAIDLYLAKMRAEDAALNAAEVLKFSAVI